MITQDSAGYDPGKKSKVFLFGTIAVAISAALAVGCMGGGTSSDDQGGGTTFDNNLDPNPGGDDPNPPIVTTGTKLYCDHTIELSDAVLTRVVEEPDSITTYNLSKETAGRTSEQPSELRASAGNNIKRLSSIIPPMQGYEDGVPTPIDLTATDGDGNPVWTGESYIHPILVSYTEQVIGDYEMGDGSADIGDPTNVDDAFVSISLDNGQSWKKERVGESASDSSTQVTWAGDLIDYPGHSHKMTMAVQGNNVLVGWLDKYCPSGNPFDLAQNVVEDVNGDGVVDANDAIDTNGDGVVNDEDATYPDDLYQVNGTQGSIDYDLPCTNPLADPESLDYDCAPNGKPVYEVPFSCVWVARGTFDDLDDGIGDYGTITWRQAEQVTSGTRDANKIWIANADIGFALAWQEDPEGLRAGKGAGPGVGWSGATTNHGADIWYTNILMESFDDVYVTDANGDIVVDENGVEQTTDDLATIAALETKPKPAIKLTYPVRVSDNESCQVESDGTVIDTKLYCQDVCEEGTAVAIDSNNDKNADVYRCQTADLDPLPQWVTADGGVTYELEEDLPATLDGDTGASRPALKILKTMDDNGDLGEYITILGYEETKGLSNSEPGVPENTDEDALVSDIQYEGKVVIFESFIWDEPVKVSAGNLVNMKVPPLSGDDTPPLQADALTYDTAAAEEDWYYENARRLVIINQVDPCEMTDTSYPFGFMFKQSFETQGGASDMYVRMNTGFTYDEFEDTVINVSGMSSDAASADVADLENLCWCDPLGGCFAPAVDEDADGTPDACTTDDPTMNSMDDYPAENPFDNTFSPRAFMRGDEIYTGFAFTPSSDRPGISSNFWIHRKVDDGDGLRWQGPQQVSFESGGTSALDPRFVATPKYLSTGLESDKSNPNVLLMSYGTANADHELDVLYSRSIDKGQTFEYVVAGTAEITYDPSVEGARFGFISHWPLPVEEKEVQLVASPDGSMGFNAWLQESDVAPTGADLEVDHDDDPNTAPVTIPDNRLGLESWLGRVDYNCELTNPDDPNAGCTVVYPDPVVLP